MSAALISAFWCMVTGMVGIFTVTVVIILCIKLLNKITGKPSKKDTDTAEGGNA